MLSDANPMVVANAIAALQEIQEVSGKEVLALTPHTLFKLLAALNECTEWGQVSGAAARSHSVTVSSRSSSITTQQRCSTQQQQQQH